MLPNLPNQTYQTYQTKPTKPNLSNQTYQTKPAKPNLPNQTYQTKPTKPSHAPTLDTWKDFTLPSTIVSNTQLDFSPFSFALGPMHWSSSWQWQPCLAVCRLFRTLTWTELANFGFFFLKNVSFIPVTKPQNLCCMVWRYFTPLKQPGKLALAVFSEVTE